MRCFTGIIDKLLNHQTAHSAKNMLKLKIISLLNANTLNPSGQLLKQFLVTN